MSLVDVANSEFRYHLSCLSNEETDDTIYTYLRKQSGTQLITIDTRGKYEKALDYLPMWPLDGSYWFVKIDVGSLVKLDKKSIFDNSLGKLVDTIIRTLSKYETCIVWFDCSHYGQYKVIKEQFQKKTEPLNEMYLSRLSYGEIALILRDYKSVFPEQLIKFLFEEYRYDVMAPYKIRDLLESDLDIKTSRDVVKQLGISDRNLRQYAYRLLSLNMNTTRVATSRNRLIQSAVSFIGSISPVDLRRNLVREIEIILHTKMIHQTGTLVDVLPLKYMFQYPDLFRFDKEAAKKIVAGLYENAGDMIVTETDKVQAMKDNVHPRAVVARWEIETKIPALSLQRIQRLYLAIRGTTETYEWYTKLDVMEFIHTWIAQEVKILNETTNSLPSVEILKLGR